MIVMKFGGTSVGDIERLRNVAGIVRAHRDRAPVIVASAMAGVTNLLIDTAEKAVERNDEAVGQALAELRRRHREVADTLLTDAGRHRTLIERQEQLFEELSKYYRGVSLLRELSARSLDAIAAFGELLSCLQITDMLNDSGAPAAFIDSRSVVRTDATFGDASVDFPHTYPAVCRAVSDAKDRGAIPVITGFIASTSDGLTTTIGRSGSDYTASIVGAAIDAGEIWIWTDVDGVMSADPRYVSGAHVLSEISYREAAEMSYFGAKVIHPKTMLPAIEKQIPVRIKNTFNPEHPGTLISPRTSAVNGVVKTITSIDDLSLVSIEGNGMIGVPGVAARIFDGMRRVRVNVMMISQASSEHNVCFVVPASDCPKALGELRREFALDLEKKLIDDISVHEPVGIIAIVGEGMKGTRGIAGRTFTSVADANVNIVAIAQGSSELNISFVVDQEDVRKTVQAVHDEFHLSNHS